MESSWEDTEKRTFDNTNDIINLKANSLLIDKDSANQLSETKDGLESVNEAFHGKNDKISINDNLCQICSIKEFKYKCPGCSIKTCGIDCIKMHKEVNKCSGIRDRTAYVRPRDYTDANFLSDYKFLEDVSRFTDTTERDIIRKDLVTNTMHHMKAVKPNLGFRKKILERECRKRPFNLKFMPSSMKRASLNKSYYNTGSKELNWSLEICYMHFDCKIQESNNIANTTNGSFTISHTPLKAIKVTENSNIEKLPIRYILDGTYTETMELSKIIEDHLLQDKVKRSITNIIFSENKDKDVSLIPHGIYFWDLEGDIQQEVSAKITLNNALQNKNIVEFPRFLVYLESSDSK